MVKWKSQSKTPPQNPEDRHIYCILLIRIAFCHVSENLPLRCLFYVTMNIYFCFLHVTSSQFCLYLLNIYHFTYTFSHAHTEAHTNKHTCTISTQEEYRQPARNVITILLIFAKYLSLYLHIFTCTYRGTHTQAHMYNQHTRGMSTTRHRSLVERGGRKALLETLHTQTQKQNKKQKNVRKPPKFTNLNKTFEHIELPAKLLDYFLRSNKSNINQYSLPCHALL